MNPVTHAVQRVILNVQGRTAPVIDASKSILKIGPCARHLSVRLTRSRSLTVSKLVAVTIPFKNSATTHARLTHQHIPTRANVHRLVFDVLNEPNSKLETFIQVEPENRESCGFGLSKASCASMTGI